MKRRRFIKFAGTGLALACLPASSLDASELESDRALAPFVEPFLTIATDGSITIIAKHLEMGQGVYTGLASIVAEELDAAWSSVRVEAAPVNKALYGHLVFGAQTTGGSTSMSNSWDQLREAGATARAMLVAAAAQRFAVPAASLTVADGVVSDATGRRASFGELADAAARLPVPHDVPLKDPSTYRLIGTRLPRVDSPAKTNGTATFAGDICLPGMKVALLQRPPRFGAVVASFDDRASLAVPGVRRVVGVPRDKPRSVAVIADDTWAAIRGRKVLQVTWDDSQAERRSSSELVSLYANLARDGAAIEALTRGSPATAMAAATRVVEADYALPYLAHQAMEPIVSVAVVREGRCDIWAGSQNVTADHAAAAVILGLGPEQVRLNTTYAGGSFGRRATFGADWIGELAHVLVATDSRWPIKLMWTREDDIGGGYYRPVVHHRLRAGLDRAGSIVAVEQTIVAQSFLFPPPPDGRAPSKADPLVVDGALPARYAIGDATVRWVHPRVGVPVQMYRALALNHTTFTKEVFMDELARSAGRDPVAYRLLHLDSRQLPQARQSEVLRLVAARAGWGGALPRGVAIGLAVQEAEGSFIAQAARVRLHDERLTVERVDCVVDCGRPLNPDVIRAQVESGIAFGLTTALYSDIVLIDGVPRQSNFHDQPVLRMQEMPRDIDVHIIASDRSPTGIGEPGSVCIAPAVANALAVLRGTPIRTLPLGVRT